MKNSIAAFYRKAIASISVLLTGMFLFQGAVIVQWSPNKEDDLKGYKLYYGNHSRQYSSVIDVGLVTSYTLQNLEGGKNYYFTLTAYDTAGNESYFSNEVSVYIPGKNINPNDNLDVTNEPVYNFPNPFDPANEITHIRYVLQQGEKISIKIKDVHGYTIRTIIDDEYRSSGEHIEDIWDGRTDDGKPVKNGVYYCVIKGETFQQHIAIAILK